MENLFIPYKQALELKILGFDEQCLCYYSAIGEHFIPVYSVKVTEQIVKNYSYEGGQHYKEQYYKAPLWSQAFRFFREKYKMDSWLEPVNYAAPNNVKIGYKVVIIGQRPISFYKTYEEAELVLLNKLIELCKKKE